MADDSFTNMADDSTNMADGHTWLSWAAAVIEESDERSMSSASSVGSASASTTSLIASEDSSSSDSDDAVATSFAKPRAKTKGKKAAHEARDKENRRYQRSSDDEEGAYYVQRQQRQQVQQALAIDHVQNKAAVMAEKQDAYEASYLNCEYAIDQEEKAIRKYEALKEALAQAMREMDDATTLAKEARDDVKRAKFRALSAGSEFDEALSAVKNADALRSLGIS